MIPAKEHSQYLGDSEKIRLVPDIAGEHFSCGGAIRAVRIAPSPNQVPSTSLVLFCLLCGFRAQFSYSTDETYETYGDLRK